MMNRLLVIIACLGLAASMSGCTSNDSKQDTEVTSDYDSSELENVEGGGEIAADSDVAPPTDQLPEEALGEVSPSEPPASDLAVTPETPMDTSSPLTEAPTTETAMTDSSTTTDLLPPAPAEENTTVLDTAPTTSEASAEPAKPASVPLQKVASTPWKVGKTLYNAVYFARPGESLDSISQNIYGTDKTAELKKGNPTYNSRDVKPGDKVYYNSPQRPDDNTKILTFNEDNGIAPQIYTAKAGDNIRKVSKELFGYDQAWKEVWATNSVESKSSLDEGTQLKYWPGAATASAAQTPPPPSEMAMNTPPAESMPQEMPPQAASNDFPPPPPQQAMNDLPPPPPPADMAQELPPPPPPPSDFAQNEMALPPPPPPAEMAPPPVANNKADHLEPAQGMDSDTTMALAAVGLAAAGLAALIVIRKKRKQREMEQVMHDTQVGT